MFLSQKVTFLHSTLEVISLWGKQYRETLSIVDSQNKAMRKSQGLCSSDF